MDRLWKANATRPATSINKVLGELTIKSGHADQDHTDLRVVEKSRSCSNPLAFTRYQFDRVDERPAAESDPQPGQFPTEQSVLKGAVPGGPEPSGLPPAQRRS